MTTVVARELVDGCQAVLLDLDNTLLDYAAARDAAVVTWVQEVAPEQLADGAGALVSRWARLEREHFDRYTRGEATMTEQRRARVLGLLGPRPDPDALFARFLELSEQHWRPLPGVVEAVRALAATRPVGVLSNGILDVQSRKLDRIGLSDLPRFVSSHLPAPKPDRRAFEAACAGLGARPGQTVMVGDDLATDVEGALAAGLQAVLVAGRPGPVPTVASVADLLN
ncbi:MAG: HAD family hydrolase [Actinomycetia bacterium]|nr:HAD family hydrolase [Actinomycetes bacterium]